MSQPLSSLRQQQRLQDARVQTHPCYSKDAHQYARIHLPVAPACNIQCNYCNRKFDCSNETRPGVVSNLLSPAQAVHRFQSVKQRMPELKVVGIAGPGDPLANPNATLATLAAIKALDEDVHLCVSTNGLNLPSHIEALAALNVHHLTITINSLNPDIGALLYSWVYFNNQRYRGAAAAEILLQQQLLGLSLAADAGILVKVNTVLVPGVNDAGLPALAKEIQRRGALLHNIMPLISEPEHGTYFGLNGVKGPNEDQLKNARMVAGNDITQMSHCQQCRADAVGKLTNDQSCQAQSTHAHSPSTRTLGRVAVASTNGDCIDTHFGYAKHFYIYDLAANGATLVEKREVAAYCHGAENCNDDSTENHSDKTLAASIATIADCQYVSCSRIGMPPWQALEKNSITPVIDHALFPVADALNLMIKQYTDQHPNNQPEIATKEAC